MNLFFIAVIGIGFATGLRSMTAPAVVAWAGYLGMLDLRGSSVAFMASPVSVILFSLLAVGELIADKLPFIPKRTAIGPLLVRLISGALCGACLSAHHSLGVGALAGAIGGVVGAFAGYHTRHQLVSQLHIRDLFVALPEDAVAIGLAIFSVRFA